MNPASTEDTARFVALLTGVQSRLYAYLYTLLARPEDARDVLQETNLILWEKLADYDPARSFEPWAFRFAHWQALAWRKRQSHDRLTFDDAAFEIIASEFPRAATAEQELRMLEACLEKLPARQRAIVERRYFGRESVNAIAAAERKPPNAIAASLYRARKLLADCMAETAAGTKGLA